MPFDRRATIRPDNDESGRFEAAPLDAASAFGSPEGLLPAWLPLVPTAVLRFNLGILDIVTRGADLAVRGKYDTEAWSRSSRATAHLVEACGGKLEISGLAHLENTSGPVVLAGNHASSLETFLLPHLILAAKGRAGFVVKKELLDDKRFGPIMKAVPHVALTRGQDMQSMKEDLRTLREEWPKLHADGVSVCIFPTGTRSYRFDRGEFSAVAAKTAQSLGAQTVPFAVKTDMWRNEKNALGLYRVEPGTVRVAFGPALPAGMDAKAVQAGVLKFVQEKMVAWGIPVVGETRGETRVSTAGGSR